MRVVTLLLVPVAAVALILSGCKDTGRPTSYEKGVYAGKADQKLTSDQVKALRQRGAQQK